MFSSLWRQQNGERWRKEKLEESDKGKWEEDGVWKGRMSGREENWKVEWKELGGETEKEIIFHPEMFQSDMVRLLTGDFVNF